MTREKNTEIDFNKNLLQQKEFTRKILTSVDKRKQKSLWAPHIESSGVHVGLIMFNEKVLLN